MNRFEEDKIVWDLDFQEPRGQRSKWLPTGLFFQNKNNNNNNNNNYYDEETKYISYANFDTVSYSSDPVINYLTITKTDGKEIKFRTKNVKYLYSQIRNRWYEYLMKHQDLPEPVTVKSRFKVRR